MPAAYRPMLDWYDELCDSVGLSRAQDPILALRGLGKELWRGEEADTYAPQLGEGWQRARCCGTPTSSSI